jgi:hypothetical protein
LATSIHASTLVGGLHLLDAALWAPAPRFDDLRRNAVAKAYFLTGSASPKNTPIVPPRQKKTAAGDSMKLPLSCQLPSCQRANRGQSLTPDPTHPKSAEKEVQFPFGLTSRLPLSKTCQSAAEMILCAKTRRVNRSFRN